ncbi:MULTISPECIES: serine hydrolase [unclassified Acidovorax]|uniref:serine hydrolase n=1 Tax=unclassified Acidovorax TaxID=2684926 RepID=UPI002882DE2C|nr:MULTISPECIES: serine hydrolase [unclassified Acidovorax]
MRPALAALAMAALPCLPPGAFAQAPSPSSPSPQWQSAPAPTQRPAAWARAMHRELERAVAAGATPFGVYVRDLNTGEAMSFHAGERWYLASSVKVPVAVAVLRGVERGAFTLDTPLTLREADYVDGAGPAKRQPVGSALTVRWLLEQMIIYSDNTATDMLIGLVGQPAVNAVAQEAVPGGLDRITTLADVRRHAYSQLTPEAVHLSGSDFLTLKAQRGDREVKETLARLVRVPTASLAPIGVGDAFEAYYATGLNSGRLDAYGELLAQLVQGRLLNAAHTRYLLDVMERVKTGPQRIKAGLPSGTRFAHKTGTQRARTCDSGLVTFAPSSQHTRDARVIVVACTRGELSTTRSDRTLRQVGIALCQSGLLSHGKPHEPPCQTVPALTQRAPPDALPMPAVTGRTGPAPGPGVIDDDLRGDEP